MKEKDIVFGIIEQMLNNSPKRSFKRLNPALRSTLTNCIESDLPFLDDTFERVFEELRGSWWFGDGAGSSVGEHFYTVACGLGQASAQQSFEYFAGRPACLWEEEVRTPLRLHVGAQLTWRGHFVTVTSMRKDSLVACTYKDYRPDVDGLKVGATIGYGPGHVITSAEKDGTATVLRVVKAKNSGDKRDVAKRFTISYSEISALRRTANARLKLTVDHIAKCDPEKDAHRLTKEINAEHFRHFELEEIRSAFLRRKDWLKKEGAVEAWRKGENGAWLDIKETIVRINGDRVECSNGNSVSRATASAVLPVLLDRRHKSEVLSLPLDSYRIERVGRDGVKIGCTLVPWPEIERIAAEL